MTRTITVIPAKETKFTQKSTNKKKKRKVAGYARVSTSKEEQLMSYEAQVEYYTNYIKNNPEWEFVGVYTDEGITATNTKRRDGFNEMIEDALKGEIDLIITKSVSRFARNTVDSLVAVRELKANGVEVYFEKENIYTCDGNGELLITIMSSLAQEESRSISENVTWGCRKRFADGKVSMPYKNFLGYEKGEDGTPKIVEKEALIVRNIYRQFLAGKSPAYIAKCLTKEGVPTPKGGEQWCASTVKSILKNEKYKGSALLQKTFTVDFLEKKIKINEGEIPQYYVEDSHPAIISKEVYDLVQIEFESRKKNKGCKTTGKCFSGMIFCGECGNMYGSKVWHSNTKYRQVVWQCNNKFKNEHKCKTLHLTDDVVESAFISIFNNIIENKDEVVGFIEKSILELTDTSSIDCKIERALELFNRKEDEIKRYVDLNSRVIIHQDEYQNTFDAYLDEYNKAEDKVRNLERKKKSLLDCGKKNKAFLKSVKEQEKVTEFDGEIFRSLVERITVYEDRLVFAFKNGMDVGYDLKKD